MPTSFPASVSCEWGASPRAKQWHFKLTVISRQWPSSTSLTMGDSQPIRQASCLWTSHYNQQAVGNKTLCLHNVVLCNKKEFSASLCSIWRELVHSNQALVSLRQPNSSVPDSDLAQSPRLSCCNRNNSWKRSELVQGIKTSKTTRCSRGPKPQLSGLTNAVTQEKVASPNGDLNTIQLLLFCF